MPNIRMPNMERMIIVLPAPPRLRACPALIVRGRAQYPPHQVASGATPRVGRSTSAGRPAAQPLASWPHMLLDEFFHNLGQVWVANFFQLILDAARGMRKRDQARKI